MTTFRAVMVTENQTVGTQPKDTLDEVIDFVNAYWLDIDASTADEKFVAENLKLDVFYDKFEDRKRRRA